MGWCGYGGVPRELEGVHEQLLLPNAQFKKIFLNYIWMDNSVLRNALGYHATSSISFSPYFLFWVNSTRVKTELFIHHNPNVTPFPRI